MTSVCRHFIMPLGVQVPPMFWAGDVMVHRSFGETIYAVCIIVVQVRLRPAIIYDKMYL